MKKLRKIIHKINDTYLLINCGFVIDNHEFYIIPTINIGKVMRFHIVFYFLNMIFEINFEIKNYDS